MGTTRARGHLWEVPIYVADPGGFSNTPTMGGVVLVLLGMPLWNMEELMKGYAFSLFSLSATDLGHVVR